MGSLYTPRTTDAEGKPLVVKNGPDTGKARVDFFVAVAIPKIAGHTHWSNTDWGQKILATGAAAFPQAYQSPAFAWKIEDGDSAVGNKKGRKPCDNEGWKGHWVVKFSGGYAPKVFQQPQPGTYVEVTTFDAVKPGYWVQISGNCAGNGSASQPGVYVNHGMVLFVRPDTEISFGPDAATAFAGAAVSAPLPGVAAAAPMPFVPAVPGVPALPAAAAMVPPPGLPAPVLVAPNPAVLAVPAVPAAAALPVPPTVPAVPVAPAVGPIPTTKLVGSGISYEQMLGAGWTEQTLRQHGYIV
jgi:hypothetical protein